MKKWISLVALVLLIGCNMSEYSVECWLAEDANKTEVQRFTVDSTFGEQAYDYAEERCADAFKPDIIIQMKKNVD